MRLHSCEELTRSPLASAGNGPSGGLEIEAGNSAPRQAPWTLACGGTSLSGARRSSAFSFARSALDGLEAQLALEEAELNSVRAELERAWVRLLETVERCCQGDESSCGQSEEARCFAKEVCESAIREAEETLSTVQAERSVVAEDSFRTS